MENTPQPKRSTAEHFADLRASVDTMRTQMDDVHDYVVKARQRLDESRIELRQKLSTESAKAIFRIYCTTYKHLANREDAANADEQTAFLHTLQDLIVEELRSVNCDVMAPTIGESFKTMWMTSLDKMPLTPGAVEGTVARVHSPGLFLAGKNPNPIEKAQVAVFRAEEANP